ncbi:hypothetical protein V1514DRAFT_318133 [Lipomyces japonicus]|uniref:uncharacterized protein n=1 Tax=Lipomyces japonicus TaxID=56871 RepID=UPI0034CEB71A
MASTFTARTRATNSVRQWYSTASTAKQTDAQSTSVVARFVPMWTTTPTSEGNLGKELTQLKRSGAISAAQAYPVIVWQQWVSQPDADPAALNLEPNKHIPASSWSPLGVIKHVATNWNTRLAILNRVGAKRSWFHNFVAGVVANDVYHNPATRATSSAGKSTGRVQVYLPGLDDLTRAEFQFVKRTRLWLSALALAGLATPWARYVAPVNADAFALHDDASSSTNKRRQTLLIQARVQFLQTWASTPAISRMRMRSSRLTKQELATVGQALGLIPSWLPLRLIPHIVLEQIVDRHERYLAADNILIGRWGGVWAMTGPEVRAALADRGVPSAGSDSGSDVDVDRVRLYAAIVGQSHLGLGPLFRVAPGLVTGPEAAAAVRFRNETLVDVTVLTGNN